MSTETPAAFARRLGVHKSTICRAIKAGRLTLVAGRLDITDSLRRWEETRTGSRPDVEARHAAGRQQNAPGNAGESSGPEQNRPVAADPAKQSLSGEGPSMAQHAQEILAAQNALARLSIQMRDRQRYRVDDVAREAGALGITLRGALERLVDQTAPTLAVQASAADRLESLDRAAMHLRRHIRQSLTRALRRVRARNGVEGI